MVWVSRGGGGGGNDNERVLDDLAPPPILYHLPGWVYLIIYHSDEVQSVRKYTPAFFQMSTLPLQEI